MFSNADHDDIHAYLRRLGKEYQLPQDDIDHSIDVYDALAELRNMFVVHACKRRIVYGTSASVLDDALNVILRHLDVTDLEARALARLYVDDFFKMRHLFFAVASCGLGYDWKLLRDLLLPADEEVLKQQLRDGGIQPYDGRGPAL